MKRLLLILLLSLPLVSNGQGAAAFFWGSTKTQTSGDPDANAFLSATGITDPTISDAIQDLVVAAKAHGWWDKCRVIYPFVGGTNATHKYNLKDPQNTDGAFRIVFVNSPTSSSDGISWDGTSQYGDTKFNASTELTQDDCHISYYSRTNSVTDVSVEIGSEAASGAANIFRICIKVLNGGNSFMECGNDLDNLGSSYVTPDALTEGYFITSRVDGAEYNVYRDGSALGVRTVSSNSFQNINMYIGATNRDGTPVYSQRQCAFATIGEGLDATMAADMNTDVEAFEDALSRGVQ